MEKKIYVVKYGEGIRNLPEWECEASSAGEAKRLFREVFGFNFIKIQYVEEKEPKMCHMQEPESKFEEVEVLENVMGVDEASEVWELSPGHIKNLAAENKIKAKKIGKTWVIDKTQANPKKR